MIKAINKETRQNIDLSKDIVFIGEIQRGDYICPICEKDLSFVDGEKQKTHFRHSKGQSSPMCSMYEWLEDNKGVHSSFAFVKASLKHKTKIPTWVYEEYKGSFEFDKVYKVNRKDFVVKEWKDTIVSKLKIDSKNDLMFIGQEIFNIRDNVLIYVTGDPSKVKISEDKYSKKNNVRPSKNLVHLFALEDEYI